MPSLCNNDIKRTLSNNHEVKTKFIDNTKKATKNKTISLSVYQAFFLKEREKVLKQHAKLTEAWGNLQEGAVKEKGRELMKDKIIDYVKQAWDLKEKDMSTSIHKHIKEKQQNSNSCELILNEDNIAPKNKQGGKREGEISVNKELIGQFEKKRKFDGKESFGETGKSLHKNNQKMMISQDLVKKVPGLNSGGLQDKGNKESKTQFTEKNQLTQNMVKTVRSKKSSDNNKHTKGLSIGVLSNENKGIKASKRKDTKNNQLKQNMVKIAKSKNLTEIQSKVLSSGFSSDQANRNEKNDHIDLKNQSKDAQQMLSDGEVFNQNYRTAQTSISQFNGVENHSYIFGNTFNQDLLKGNIRVPYATHLAPIASTLPHAPAVQNRSLFQQNSQNRTNLSNSYLRRSFGKDHRNLESLHQLQQRVNYQQQIGSTQNFTASQSNGTYSNARLFPYQQQLYTQRNNYRWSRSGINHQPQSIHQYSQHPLIRPHNQHINFDAPLHYQQGESVFINSGNILPKQQMAHMSKQSTSNRNKLNNNKSSVPQSSGWC